MLESQKKEDLKNPTPKLYRNWWHLFHHSPQLLDMRGKMLVWLDRLLIVASILAFGCLIAEYGFYLNETVLQSIHVLTFFALGFFVIQHFLRIILVHDRKQFFRRKWFEHIIAILVVFQFLLFQNVIHIPLLDEFLFSKLDPSATAALYLGVIQAQLGVYVLLYILRLSHQSASIKIQPARAAFLIYGFLITAGTLLLMLPRATIDGIRGIDAIFMSTSAICVTGLTTVDPGTTFTPMGQFILLALIQIGGLGIMTLTTFFAFFIGEGFGLRQRFLVGNFIAEENLGKISEMVFRIITFVVVTEVIATIFIFWSWLPEFNSWQEAAWMALFHSVSGFCNAGFSLFPDGLMNPKIVNDPVGTGAICVAAILGGLGFPVVFNLHNWVLSRLRNARKKVRLTFHSKIVLVVTLGLLICGTGLFLLLDMHYTLAGESWTRKIAYSFFMSAVARTAGFSVVDTAQMAVPTCLVVMALMWVGAGPASTAGGVKVSTFAVGLSMLKSLVRGDNRVTLFKREIDNDTVLKALGIMISYVMVIIVCTIILSMTEDFDMIDIAFEQVSALSTTGLSRGITAGLSDEGKLLISMNMLIGRLGVLTFFWALFFREIEKNYKYPRENVILM